MKRGRRPVWADGGRENRFNGFVEVTQETVETVASCCVSFTRLKPGA